MAKKGQGQQDNDDGWKIIIFPAIILLLAWFMWEYQRAPLVRFLYASDWLQYHGLKFLYGLGVPVDWGPKGEQMLRYVTACFDGRVNPSTVSMDEVYQTQTDVGNRIGITFMVPMLVMTFWIGMKMRGGQLKRTFTLSGTGKREKWFWGKLSAGPFAIIPATLSLVLDWWILKLGTWISHLIGFRKQKIWTNIGLSFMKYQAIEWKTTVPGAEFDPNVDNPNMEQSKTPTEWMRDNKVGILDGILQESSAQKVFEKQLGAPWSNYESSPDYIKAILIISWLTLKFFSHSKIVTKVRGDFAVAFTYKEKQRVKKIIEECERKYPVMIGAINGICGDHHYTNTAVLGFVAWSGPFEYWYGGSGSINAPGMWLWLKQIDRTLWYTLQCYGRRVCFVEGAGAVSHFFYEKRIGQDENTPQMDEAIKGLKRYLTYHNIVDLDAFFNRMKPRSQFTGKKPKASVVTDEDGNPLSLVERRRRIAEQEQNKRAG